MESLLILLSEKRGTSPLLIDIGNLPCLPPVSLTPAGERLDKCANSNRNAANRNTEKVCNFLESKELELEENLEQA
jgi:hypothetical protein